MAVYVDDVRHPYGRMIMCHMWADTLDELLAMADRIGVARKWLQKPPKASWVHFDICITKKQRAIALGAVLTDQYAPLVFVARQSGKTDLLDRISRLRTERGLPSDGILIARKQPRLL